MSSSKCYVSTSSNVSLTNTSQTSQLLPSPIIEPPFLSTSPPSIRAEWLPNCIARFFLMLASTSPTFLAASLNSILSPIPISSRGSIFKCTGNPAKKDTTESERNGCLVSFPCEDIIRSSRPRFRVGMRSSSSWSWEQRCLLDKEQARGTYLVDHALPASGCENASVAAVTAKHLI